MNGTFSEQTVFLRSLENFSHWLLAQRTDSEKSKASMTFPRKILFSRSFAFLGNQLYMCCISFAISQIVVCSAIFYSLPFCIL